MKLCEKSNFAGKHYAIKLNYSLDKEGGSSISEYFLPFSTDELLGFGLNKFCNKVLKYIKRNHLDNAYPLDYLIKNNFVDTNFEMLVEVDGEEFSKMTEEKNLSSTQKGQLPISKWDMLAESLLAHEMSLFSVEDMYNEERITYMRNLSELTLDSRIELLMMRIRLSLLLNMECARERSNPDPNGRYDNSTRNALQFSLEARRVSSDNEIDFELLARDVNADDLLAGYEAENIISNIIELFRINSDYATSDVQRRNNWEQIRTLGNQLHRVIKRQYNKTLYCLSVVNEIISEGYPYHEKARRISFDDYFDAIGEGNAYVVDKIYHINAEVQNFQNRANLIGTSLTAANQTISFTQWNNYRNFIGSDDVSKNFWEDYWGKGAKCFAILLTDTDKHYFSFSGYWEMNPREIDKRADTIRYIMEHILKDSSVTDIRAQNYEYNYAYLHDKLPVRRYTELLVNNDDYIGKIGPYIKGNGYETLDADLKKNPNDNKYRITYSCCERKMLAYSGYDHAKKIFSRWAPCWKCCPAVIDANDVEIWAICTLQEFFDNGRSTNGMTIKMYKVEEKKGFIVSKV